METHNIEDFKKNEREMMRLFRQMTWKDQLLLIGRLEEMIDRSYQEKIIQFPVS